MVQISISGGGQLQSPEADIIESFVVDAHDFICIFNELMDRKGRIVGLHHSVRDLGGWHH